MSTFSLSAALGNRLWQWSMLWENLRFRKGLGQLEHEQNQVLEATLRLVSTGPYGKRLGLEAVSNYETFRQVIPVQSYEEIEPDLALHQGLTSESVRVWEPTGGSTGPRKWIPWTPSLQKQFRRALAPWIWGLFHQCPQLRDGRSFWQLTPQSVVRGEDWMKRPAGFESDGHYLGALGQLMERTCLISVSRCKVNFWETLVHKLCQARDLRLISCWSPSYLFALRQACLDHLGSWEPQLWWPQLGAVSCWSQGPSRDPFRQAKALFPGVHFQGKGLLSTEAVTTVPYGGQYPLAYRSHFFEFLDSEGQVWPSWELKDQEVYEVVQTTGSGLLRYRSGDLVRVTGFLGQVPCLEFLERKATSDHFGEKLSHDFLREVLQVWDRFAALGFEEDRYVLYLDPSDHPPDPREIHRQVDENLQQNFSYRECLTLGQLRPSRCFVLDSPAANQLATLAQSHPSQKYSYLLPPGPWSQRFRGQFLKTE